MAVSNRARVRACDQDDWCVVSKAKTPELDNGTVSRNLGLGG